MSKGLEALEELKCVLSTNSGTKRYADIFNNSLIGPIEKELKELENYKKAEEKLIGVDEELKTLEGIKKWINDNSKVKGFSTQLCNEFRIIELALKDYGYLQVSFDRWVDKCLELEETLKHNTKESEKKDDALKTISDIIVDFNKGEFANGECALEEITNVLKGVFE